MTDYQLFISQKISLIAKSGSILDLGGGKRFQKWLAPYKSLFNEADYKTFDYDSTTGADIVGDIHQIPLPDNSFDSVICSSVLEHVQDPRQAVKEIHRILKPGGAVFVMVPSIYPYHARPGHYPDYWRFFEDTLNELFKDFTQVEIVKRGKYFTALSFFFPYQQKFRWFLDPLAAFLDKLFGSLVKNTTAGYYLYAIK
ncbi:MAG: class I SAM-dependent methyltransferase [Patescibacteria group bacterium]